jgi:hypothetical protein
VTVSCDDLAGILKAFQKRTKPPPVTLAAIGKLSLVIGDRAAIAVDQVDDRVVQPALL